MGTKNDPGEFDCYDKALPNEPIFVLLGRDPEAPGLVRDWVRKRYRRLGQDAEAPQLDEALCVANRMERYRKNPTAATKPVTAFDFAADFGIVDLSVAWHALRSVYERWVREGQNVPD